VVPIEEAGAPVVRLKLHKSAEVTFTNTMNKMQARHLDI
jgi:hypothetical protein